MSELLTYSKDITTCKGSKQSRVLSTVLKRFIYVALVYRIGWAWYPFLQHGMCRLVYFSRMSIPLEQNNHYRVTCCFSRTL